MTRVFTLLLLALSTVSFASAQDQANAPTEFFARRVGEWDTETSIKPGVWGADGNQSKGSEVIEWSLGKKFIRGNGKSQPGNLESMFMETYDSEAGVFRSWFFDSNGSFPRNEMIGRWDGKTNTMTYKGTDPNGVSTTVILKLTDLDHVDWTGTWQDKSGKVLMEMVGKTSRRK